MRTVDQLTIHQPPALVYQLAADVEQWPALLPHYRWVTRQSGTLGGAGLVEMAAWRPFGPLRWPTWWQSEMTTDPVAHRVTYRHVAGITRGMDVLWTIEPTPEGWSDVTIVHEWSGSRWPLIGRLAADAIIGPVFVHGIASRTLRGLAHVAGTRPAADIG